MDENGIAQLDRVQVGIYPGELRFKARGLSRSARFGMISTGYSVENQRARWQGR